MKYQSTRGGGEKLEFDEVLLAGLARDGGLYVPSSWPQFSAAEISGMAGKPYVDVAFQVMWPFVEGSLERDEFAAMIETAYAGFSHKAVAPLVQISPTHWLLELFHGPTLAFKDVAMQLLGGLMDAALTRQGRRSTIVVATSGDTGGAAIEAFRGRDAIDIFVLHPHNRVSDVQRRQMTTPVESNVFNIALDGTFDDCQAQVKALFNDHERRDRLQLSGVNSINWARILAQMVYYFTAAAALGAPGRSVNFSVPTGNFGDIFAGYGAKRMGLPIERLVIATNVNDMLARTLQSGRYHLAGVHATVSPSMDIQVSSNFERLMFELSGRDAKRVCALMEDLARKNEFSLNDQELAELRSLFSAHCINEAETEQTIKFLHDDANYIADPHTAVGVGAALREPAGKEPMVTLSTAHPAKFPDAVQKAIAITPQVPIEIARQLSRPERFDVLANEYRDVANYIESRSRAVKENV